MTHDRRRYEIRGDDGRLLAVIELVELAPAIGMAAGLVEFSADLPGRAIKVTIYPTIGRPAEEAAA